MRVPAVNGGGASTRSPRRKLPRPLHLYYWQVSPARRHAVGFELEKLYLSSIPPYAGQRTARWDVTFWSHTVSVARRVESGWVIWIAGIDEVDAAVAQHVFAPVDSLASDAAWLARLNLVLQLNESLIGADYSVEGSVSGNRAHGHDRFSVASTLKLKFT